MFKLFKKNNFSDNKQDYITLLEKYAQEPIILTTINLAAYDEGNDNFMSTLHSLASLFDDKTKLTEAIKLYDKFLDYVQENSKLKLIQKGEENNEDVPNTGSKESEN